jgi:hypothetical protein
MNSPLLVINTCFVKTSNYFVFFEMNEIVVEKKSWVLKILMFLVGEN